MNHLEYNEQNGKDLAHGIWRDMYANMHDCRITDQHFQILPLREQTDNKLASSVDGFA